MNDKNYVIEDFVKDVLKFTAVESDEGRILEKVAPLAQRAAKDDSLVREDMYLADPELGFRSTLLHSEADNSVFVVVDGWLPGRGVRPHNHGTWTVVVAIDGTEHNAFWERIDDCTRKDHAELRKIGEGEISAGEAICMKTGEIHSVENRTDQTTLSFHVYGQHLNHTGRSQFDIENNLETPFIIETR